MKKIAVAGAGYVGLANAVLLAQNEEVWIYDVAEEKVQMLKERRSPVKDKEMQEFLDGKELHLHITTEPERHLKMRNLLSLRCRQITMMKRNILIQRLWKR